MNIQIDNVSFSFNGHPVVDDVTLHPAAGRLTAILGPNGAGKTTLLRCITGALHCQQGIIKLEGRPLASLSPRQRARRMALVPQAAGMEFRFSVLDTVLMGRYPWLGRFSAESSADLDLARQVLAEVGLGGFEERPVTELSGGELQRVLVARSLCQDTPILLLDEPVSHLDIRHQVDILGIAQRRAEDRGVTVLCVLHDLNLAARFAHHMAVMKEGRLIAQGTPDEILDPALIGGVYDLSVSRIDDGRHFYLMPDIG